MIMQCGHRHYKKWCGHRQDVKMVIDITFLKLFFGFCEPENECFHRKLNIGLVHEHNTFYIHSIDDKVKQVKATCTKQNKSYSLM